MYFCLFILNWVNSFNLILNFNRVNIPFYKKINLYYLIFILNIFYDLVLDMYIFNYI